MPFIILENKLRRSKSTGALDVKYISYDYPNKSLSDAVELENVEKPQGKAISILRLKTQNLRNMVQEHQRKLKSLKEDVTIPSNLKTVITHFFEESIKTLEEIAILSEDIDQLESRRTNSLAKEPLEVKEPNYSTKVDTKMTVALSKLSTIVESNKFKESNVTGNRDTMLQKCLLPTPESDQQNEGKIQNNILKMDSDVKEGAALFLKSIHKEPKPYYAESPYDLPSSSNANIEHSNGEKMQHKMLKISMPKEIEPPRLPDTLDVLPSPPQTTDTKTSLIDHIMQSAMISKMIKEEKYNKSFEEALSLCNLSLVMIACRAADPTKVFNPCSLSQSVLLSLVQQLATDMVHETQLKCRYLEEALINIRTSDSVTKIHLPLIVDEVRKHLSNFVRAYPNHVASRRISLIIMAADNLLK